MLPQHRSKKDVQSSLKMAAWREDITALWEEGARRVFERMAARREAMTDRMDAMAARREREAMAALDEEFAAWMEAQAAWSRTEAAFAGKSHL